jgi:hypothetical protein
MHSSRVFKVSLEGVHERSRDCLLSHGPKPVRFENLDSEILHALGEGCHDSLKLTFRLRVQPRTHI